MNNLRILFLQKTAAVIPTLLLFGAVMIMSPEKSTAEEAEAEVATTEATGTVDSVQDNAVIISDSFVPVNSSVLLYDQYGKKTELSSFEAGDQVLVTSVDDEVSGEQRIMSVSLMKNTRQNSTSSNQSEKKSNQMLRKVNGVWTN